MELLISEGALIARLTFPDQCGLIASPGSQVPVETVVRDIDLAANEPFSMRRLPLQNHVPLLEPVKLLLRKAPPKRLRVSARFRAQPFRLLHSLDVGLLGKSRRRRKDSIFSLEGFDVCSGR